MAGRGQVFGVLGSFRSLRGDSCGSVLMAATALAVVLVHFSNGSTRDSSYDIDSVRGFHLTWAWKSVSSIRWTAIEMLGYRATFDSPIAQSETHKELKVKNSR